MFVVGLDPSVRATGLVVLQGAQSAPVFEAQIVPQPALAGLERVVALTRTVCRTMEQHAGGAPALVVIEGYAFGNKHSLATLVELGTALRLEFYRRRWRYLEPSPAQVKKFVGAVGKGKLQTQVRELWGFETKSSDIADAYVMAKIGVGALGLVPVNERQQDVILSCRHGVRVKTAN